ncbi:hypothetical protein N9J16_00695 [Candidatus Poseidoniaceae archaeon]|nr:hypothetical protein [Candidatus Poseidoniaceae archaeon]
MSYITRTGTIQMVDVECVREVLEQIGATDINISGDALNCRYDGYSITFSKGINGVISLRVKDPEYYRDNAEIVGESTSHINLFNDLERRYPIWIREKQENLRKEKENQERLRLEKIRIQEEIQAQKQQDFDLLSQDARAVQIEQQKKSAQRLQELDSDLNESQKALETVQGELSRVAESRKNFLEITQKEIIQRGEEGGWKLSENFVEEQRNVTRIQLRKKQTN